MRISTSTLFDVNVTSLNTQQSKLLHTQQQLSTGRRILTPADDPTAAARAIQVAQADGTNTQYLSNIGTTNDAVSLSEGTLQGVTTLLQNIQTTAVQAGNPVLANSDRAALASTLQDNLNQLIAMANSKDAVGNYLFSGFKGGTQPFVNTATGVQYQGDDGQRLVQVGANRQLAASDSGADIFMRIKNGNGTFTTTAAATNTGSGIASQGNVINPALLTGNNYQVTFTSANTYSVFNTTLDPTMVGAPLSSGSYVSGQAISFDGMQFSIQGAPASGDKFTVAPSANESVFTTISNLITTLNTPTIPGNSASTAQLTAGVNLALNGMDNALNSVLTTRASLGSRLNELDSLKTSGSDLGVQFKQTLSQLQDVDYNKAITDLTQQQTMLTAAQKSFLQVQNLSMFNYMQ